ncbi:mannose-1-phosphate guanylyltransferase/mannose-6-phosphate isomerase [Agaribacterium haliotis]|uniref:mannose-1-phosphate guanylyltransferase/mannose-6-phosphate isomerase n=1 Tax=Agaribacterium haliotis TaxID=2013869 RepID=UPI000BB558D2|nr:mannose-1-phosphate guanylyltransferase/mannose-6-phosphate isomerase [Agaribacterium haliotis]
MSFVQPVILSGGSGTRLWPKSRKAYPKQLHTLYGDYTMLQHTVLRVATKAAPMVICNDSQRFMVAEQLAELTTDTEKKVQIILEPIGRNTAPAIAVAALQALKTDANAVLVVLPADHLIKDTKAFQGALDIAINKAEEGLLVAFGIVPSAAETGYGYINAASSTETGAEIKKFVEKPDSETAQAYVDSGEFFWNSGMFVFKAQGFIDELTQFEPAIVEHANTALLDAKEDLDFCRLDEAAFSQCNDISVDYAVMEKTSKAWMVPLDANWSDLGSWESLYQSLEKDENGNVCKGDIITYECSNSLFHSENKLISAIGLKDIAVIDTDDSLLVCNLADSQNVKHIVDKLKTEGRSESSLHRKVYRPWGSYDSIGSGERYQVKCIEVKPGASLSLQMHHHRAEHWIVVSGTAIVHRGEEEHLLSENQSIYIPLGETHRLTNPGKIPLQLIEVQSGSYLGEDDIVRFEDTFGRV